MRVLCVAVIWVPAAWAAAIGDRIQALIVELPQREDDRAAGVPIRLLIGFYSPADRE
jgi:hypothetical protein